TLRLIGRMRNGSQPTKSREENLPRLPHERRGLQSPALKTPQLQQRRAIEPFRMNDPVERSPPLRREVLVELNIAADHFNFRPALHTTGQRSREIRQRKRLSPDEHVIRKTVKTPHKIRRIPRSSLESRSGNRRLGVSGRSRSRRPVNHLKLYFKQGQQHFRRGQHL